MIKDKFPRLVFDYKSSTYKNIGLDKFLFHHIPKTAGSTFRGILENLFTTSQVCPAETPKELQEANEKGRNGYKLFGGHFSYGSICNFLDDSVWVTFLRNPIDRVVSHYYNHSDLKRIPETWQKRVDSIPEWQKYIEDVQGVSLLEWMNHKNKTVNSISCNRQTQAFIPDEIRIKVEDWGIYDEKLITIAKQNLKEKFAFVGIQEYFDLSLDLFSATFALNPIDATNYTTNLNTKKSRESKYDLDEEVLAIVKAKNQMDLELYEYGVELLFERMHHMNQVLLSNNRVYMMNRINQSHGTFKNRVDITEVYATHGFYALEGQEYKVFKWSGYQTPSIVEFLYDFESSKNYKIKIEVLALIDESILEKLEMIVDDMACSFKTSKEGTTTFISVELDDIKRLSMSKFHTIKIISSLQMEGEFKGARQLGLALHAIEIIPLKA